MKADQINKITFTYNLVGKGWSEAEIKDGESRATLTASYLSDALGDLVRAILGLLGTADKTTCSWAEEPGEYRWIFKKQGDSLFIKIVWFDVLWTNKPDEEGTSVFSSSCKLRRFSVQLKNQLEKLLDQYGLDDYRQKWGNYDFPLSEYEKLSEIISNTKAAKV